MLKKRIVSAVLMLCMVLTLTVSVRADGVSVSVSVSGGNINITLTGYQKAEGVSQVRAAVWSENNGQDDLAWYVLNDSFAAAAPITAHKYDSGRYFIHVYAFTSAGAATFVEGAAIDVPASEVPAQPAPAAVTMSANDTSGNGSQFDIVIANYTGSSARVAVWSEANGQDDLKWYDMTKGSDGAFHSSVSAATHKNSGKCYAHAYSGNTFIEGVAFNITVPSSGSTSADSLNPVAEALDINGSAGTATLKVSGVNVSNIKKVSIAAWSKSDQSDLLWYDMSAAGNGVYTAAFKISNHKNNYGKYYAHAYLFRNDGSAQFLNGVAFDMTKPNTTAAAAPVVTADASGNSRLLKITNVPSNIKQVRFALWSENGGQDDLKWYTGTLSGTTATNTVDMAAHPDTGKFDLHVYGFDASGNASFLGGLGFTVEQAAIDTSAKKTATASADSATGNFSIKVTGAESYAKEVRVAVWSRSNQSDLKWYTMTKASDGSYSLSSNVSSHGNTIGTFNCHVYITYADNKARYACGTQFSLKMLEGKVSIGAGTDETIYPVSVSGMTVLGGVKSLKFGVWSDAGGQDDLLWYTATNNNGTWTANVDISDHRTAGVYHVHAYATSTAGDTGFVGAASGINVKSTASGKVSYDSLEKDKGTFRVKGQVTASSSTVAGMKFRVWNTGDDEKWYTGVKAGSEYVAKVNILDHQVHTGTYHFEAYAVMRNNLEVSIGTGTLTIEPESYTGAAQIDGSAQRRLLVRNDDLTSVRFAVWTESGGQDDLVWYEGKSDGNGGFYADVLSKNHKHDGTYIVHMYTGNTYIGGLTFTMIDYLEWAYETANDDSVGYSQANRDLNPDVDCSSFVYYALKNGGYADELPSQSFYTGNEAAVLQKAGFTQYTFTSETSVSDLKPGDILLKRLNSSGHTEIYLGDGYTIGAHDGTFSTNDTGHSGDQTGNEVSVAPYSNQGWMWYFRDEEIK